MATKTYGNAANDIISWAGQNSFLDSLFTWGKEHLHFPDPESDDTKTELLQVKEYLVQLGKSEDHQKRFTAYDTSLFGHLHSYSFPNAPDKTEKYRETVNALFADAWPVIYKLKLHFQRPRPFQLAAMHNIDLHPYPCYSDHSPAFPSMHACMGMLMFYVMGNQFPYPSPDIYKMFKDLSEDIGWSRIYLGVCTMSDMQAGATLAGQIMDEREFKIKYKL